jgi:peroxiredoxin
MMKPAPLSKLTPIAQLTIGDIAPNCVLLGTDGTQVNLLCDSIAGNPIVLAFCPRLSGAGMELLDRFANCVDVFTTHGARIFVITPESAPNTASTKEYRYPILIDEQQQAFNRFGVPRDRPTTVVIRRNYHVAGIFDAASEVQVEETLALLNRLSWERAPVLMNVHPPVLLIPDVFSRDECTMLINIFETKGQTYFQEKGAFDYLKGSDYKMRIPEHMREDRIDHFFFERDTVAFLVNRLTRVTPEIMKAFHYRISKYETLRVACYKGHRGGYSHGHRDNIQPYTYRRFAMSINLNTEEFEGGELRFPEFGDQRYRPETGTAIVFSSSLLHEAMHVTSGRRFVFLAFLFGEA